MVAASVLVERHHLTRAEQHIAEGEQFISRQVALVERLRTTGGDTALAEKILTSLRAVLKQHHHRALILERIAQLQSWSD